MTKNFKVATAALALGGALIFPFGFMAAQGNSMKSMKMSSQTVYVCSCMKTKSCPCETEANMEGKCACGMKASEMKAVPKDSAWARANRRGLEEGPRK
ncbi:MAG: hypothetical protein EPN47_04425 [Acidobacteria bacterium]|nr:MAG: hypothetical protein EPN47_04425 [Acidobacteriota bacterium]